MADSPYSRALTILSPRPTLPSYSSPQTSYYPSYPLPQPPKPPSVWDVYKQLKEPEPAPSPVQSAVTGLRQNAEGGAVGALLGLIHGEFGTLDIHGRFPIDGIAALVFYGLSIRDAARPDGFPADLRAISQSCTTTLLYRKSREWRENAKKSKEEAKQEASSAKPKAAMPRHSDPIVEAARRNGLMADIPAK